MTVTPGRTCPVTNGCSEAEDPSASTAIRHRPIPLGSLTSTAMPVSTFLPGARPPRGPRPAPGAFEAPITEPPAHAVPAVRAAETARPAQPLQVVQAVLVGAEPGLKFACCPW